MGLNAHHRLITYGTLIPGGVNHDQLSDLEGSWHTGTVRGRLINRGWGAEHGCPGIVLDPTGPQVQVHIFESIELPHHWARLDRFEGDGYRRSTVTVLTESGEIEGSIYELAI